MPLCSYLLRSCETQFIKYFRGSKLSSTRTQSEKPLLTLCYSNSLQHIGEMENVHRGHLCTHGGAEHSRAQRELVQLHAADMLAWVLTA